MRQGGQAAPFAIRSYDGVGDLEACVSIWRSASEIAHPFLTRRQLDEDEQLVRDCYIPAARLRLADAGAGPLGFIALLDGFIGALFVEPRHHGLGIGRALVEDARRDRSALDVEVYERNASALAFYRSLGFELVGRRDADDRNRPFALLALRLKTKSRD